MRRSITPGLLETILFCITFILVLLGIFYSGLRPTIESAILIPIYSWGILALFGLLTPNVKHRFTIGFGFDPARNIDGYPILISLISKGGFICHNPIIAKAEVSDITPPEGKGKVHEAKKLFKKNFEEFNIVWFSSQSLEKKGGVLKDQPEAGGIKMAIEKCSGKSKIVFTSSGEYGVDLMFKPKGGRFQSLKINKKNIPQSFIKISPPENLHQIRIGNITYGLALFVLGFGLYNLLSTIW
ncbi:MAG: hypothetical protein ISS41_09825 [Candidatus Aminicenantes bacterium]|nr:hypothetical protein [Candidatus Aminicenantes bacterium]